MTHNVISDALNILERRPRRGLISLFLRGYPFIMSGAVTLLMALAGGPYAPKWTAMWIGGYWAYFLLKSRLGQKQIFGQPYHSKWVQFSRSLFLVICAALFLAYLYGYTDYLRANHGRDSLWLLFLRASFIMSQYGDSELMVLMVSIASTLLVAISVWAEPQRDWLFWSNVAGKVGWLFLLAFMLHVLLRYLRDWYASIRFLHDTVGRDMLEIRTVSHEHQLLAAVVGRVAADFNYPHVNLLYIQPDKNIQYVAGACPTGQELAAQGYTLQQAGGIIRHVIATGQTHLANNVDRDPYYVPFDPFPQTRAELVVPIKLRGEIVGALDVLSHQKNIFFPADREVLEIIATHFARALDNIRLLRSRQQINQIVEKIARRFLSQHELESTLDQIAQAAHTELVADVVVLYEYNPAAGYITGPAYAGELYAPDQFSASAFEPDSLVQRLLDAEEDYFQETVGQLNPAYPEASPVGKSPFVEREQIKSRAIVRLRTDVTCVGVMFLNFRSARRFEAAEKATIFSFAHLAALAIQKSQFHQQQLDFERQNLARRLHDQLIANTDAVARILQMLHRDNNCTPAQKDRLAIAIDAIQELKQDIRYLNETLQVKCIVLTAFVELPNFLAAFDAGAEAFIRKDARPDQQPGLADLVRLVVANGRYYDSELVGQMRAYLDVARVREAATNTDFRDNPLTERENEVLLKLSQGKNKSEIAQEFVIAENTVKTHIGNIYNKLGAKNRRDAILIAMSQGWLNNAFPDEE